MAAASGRAISIPALLFSVAVVGGLIGFGWERAVYREPVHSEEWAPPELPGHGEVGSRRGPQRTPEEEAILQRALVHFPPYPRGSAPDVLAADYLGPGVPMAVAWFSTQDTPRQVLEHYAKVLADAGLPVIREHHGENGGYVGYWAPDSFEVRLVSVLAQGGETLVFVSSGQVKPLLEREQTVPPGVPLPPGLSKPVSMRFNMEGTTHQVVSGQLSQDTLGGAEARYRATLREQGWRAGETESVEAGGIAFDVERGETLGRAVLREQAPGVELRLSLLQRGATP
jgi:hypothetical protein